MKNSLRAVHDRFEDADDDPPPIRLVVAEGEEDITIKVGEGESVRVWGGGWGEQWLSWFVCGCVSVCVFVCVEVGAAEGATFCTPASRCVLGRLSATQRRAGKPAKQRPAPAAPSHPKLPPLDAPSALAPGRHPPQVSDEGGGIPRSGLPRMWTYLYTTAKSPLEEMDNTEATEGSDGPSVLAG